MERHNRGPSTVAASGLEGHFFIWKDCAKDGFTDTTLLLLPTSSEVCCGLGFFLSLIFRRFVRGICVYRKYLPKLMFDSTTRACRTKLKPAFRSALQPWADFNGVTMSRMRSTIAVCLYGLSYRRGMHTLFRSFPAWGDCRIANVRIYASFWLCCSFKSICSCLHWCLVFLDFWEISVTCWPCLVCFTFQSQVINLSEVTAVPTFHSH